jgi:hypothetical protein
MKEWSTLGIKGYIRLMIEFLRMSPTYELARKARNEGLSRIDKRCLPDDFDLVLATYDEFGDISEITFDKWWSNTGIYIYGSEYEKPRVHLLGEVKQGMASPDQYRRALDTYLNVNRPKEGNPVSMIISMPLGMNKRYLLGQVSKLIDKAEIEVPVKAKKAKKELTATRLRSEPLFKMIHLLWLKAAEPKMTLWQMGVKAKISEKHIKGLSAGNVRLTAKNQEDRESLQILTSRYLLKAKRVAENAARGRFPSYDPIALPEFDSNAMYARYKKYRIIQLAAKRKH